MVEEVGLSRTCGRDTRYLLALPDFCICNSRNRCHCLKLFVITYAHKEVTPVLNTRLVLV